MGKKDRGLKKAALQVNPVVVEFVEAAAVGDVKAVKKIAKSGSIEIDDDVDGVTALMRACGNGHLKAVEELLVHGAGMWCAGPTGDPKTPFMWAAHYGQLDIIRYFVEEVGLDDLAINKGAGKSGRKTARDYALDAGNNLGEEAKAGKAKVLAYLQENGAEHGEGVTDPETVFDGAARGDVNYVHFCLEANGSIISMAHGAERSSLLHVASNTGNTVLMQSLISHGADVEARNALDTTPLISAATAGNVDALRMLIDNGATLEHRDSNGDTALHHACEAGHLECVRALLGRDCPPATAGTDDETIVRAILEGDAPEHQAPARILSPHELLVMKNRAGHTPVIKAFAGGVHVAVIRYIVGVQDGNVDPIKCGMTGADVPALLSRQLATDGIVLNPPTPQPMEEEESKETSGGLFTCGEDNADENVVEPEDNPRELEETKEREQLFASNGVPYPVYVPPGPSSQGHRRMARFLGIMKNAVWGFDPEQVFVLSKPAVVAQNHMPTFKEAEEHHLLQPLSSVPPAAKVLYVSHRWTGQGEPDTQDAHAFMQVKRYLEEHSGDNIQYIWIDVSCIDVHAKESVRYEQYMSNVVTVLSRATHMLAVPPCKVLDPRALVRDMVVARMAEKQKAAGKTPEYLKKVPSTLSLKPGSGFALAEPSSVASGSGGHLAPLSTAVAGGGVMGIGTSGRDAAVAKAVEEEIDVAILARRTAHPDKWSGLVASSEASDGGATTAGVKTPEEGVGAGGAPSKEGAAGGGAGIPPRPSTGGGDPATTATSSAKKGGGKKNRRSSGGMGSKKSSAAEMAGEATAVGDGGAGLPVMSKKEKTALLVAEAREDAAAAAAEVTHDVAQTPAVLSNPVLYSDPAALLNRGWVEMEVSLALVFGVEVLVSARWGPKVTFQSVLARALVSEDGETEEQAPGFKGAFMHAVARIAPDVVESKGFVVGVKRAIIGPERTADPTVPVRVVYAPMLEQCHEPQTVVPPLVRASLALHNEGALLPFLAGDATPVDVMYRLSGLALQDVKDGFAGLGPISDEGDRVTLVRLYLIGLSYAMGIVPVGKEAVGKPKYQVVKEYEEAQRKIAVMEREMEGMRTREMPPPEEPAMTAPAPPPPSAGCGCVVITNPHGALFAKPLKQRGDINASILQYRLAIDLNNDTSNAWLNLGIALSAIGRDDEAMSAYKVLVELPTALPLEVATAFCEHGNIARRHAGVDFALLEEALLLFERGLEILPENPSCLYNFGLATEELRRNSEARDLYLRALTLDPSMGRAHLNIGNIAFRSGNWAEGKLRYEKAYASPDADQTLRTVSTYMLGQLHRYGLEDPRSAAGYYSRSFEIDNTFTASLCGILKSFRPLCLWEGWESLDARVASAIVDGVSSGQGPGPQSPFATLFTGELKASQRLGLARLASQKYDRVERMSLPQDTNILLFRRRQQNGEGQQQQQQQQQQQWQRQEDTGPKNFDGVGETDRYSRWLYYQGIKTDDGRKAMQWREGAEEIRATPAAGVTANNRVFAVAASYGPDDAGSVRRSAEKCFGKFLDLHWLERMASAKLVAAERPQIFVDLVFHTLGARPGVVALKPAPIVVTYLAYPGTVGAEYADYAIVDQVAVPPELANIGFSEKVVYLPHSYQLVTKSLERAYEAMWETRELGLPPSHIETSPAVATISDMGARALEEALAWVGMSTKDGPQAAYVATGRVLAGSPSSVEALGLRGVALHLLGRLEEAWRAWKLASEIQPGQAPPTVVALYCYEYGNALFPHWSPSDLEVGRGLGGSEEVVIHLSRELANLGFWVEVFAEPKEREVERDNGYGRDGGGVVWYPYKAYDIARPPDVFISWRYHVSLHLADGSGRRFLWLHDPVPPFFSGIVDMLDGIVCPSRYHASRIEPDHIRSVVRVVPNGIDPRGFQDGTNSPDVFVFGSAPNRGLRAVLLMWPYIRSQIRTATLEVYYGFSRNFLKWGEDNITDFDEWMVDMKQLLGQEGVLYKGMVDHETLYAAYARAGFVLYPSTFPEIGCNSLIKAMAMGAIPITSRYPTSPLPELTSEWDMGPLQALGSHNKMPEQDVAWLEGWAKAVVHASTTDRSERDAQRATYVGDGDIATDGDRHDGVQARRRAMKAAVRKRYAFSTTASLWAEKLQHQ
eukprot:g11275.t1